MITDLCEFVRSGLVLAEAPVLLDRNFRPIAFPATDLLDERSMEVIMSRLTSSFNQRGYAGTSIPQVAASLGVSKTSIYKYAPSKEELLYACARQTLDLLGQVRQIAKVITDDPATSLLLNLFYSRYLQNRPPGPLLAAGNFRSLTKEHERVAWTLFDKWRADLVQLFDTCASQGQLRVFSPGLVLPLTNVFSTMPIISESIEDGYHDEVAQFILYGLANETGKA